MRKLILALIVFVLLALPVAASDPVDANLLWNGVGITTTAQTATVDMSGDLYRYVFYDFTATAERTVTLVLTQQWRGNTLATTTTYITPTTGTDATGVAALSSPYYPILGISVSADALVTGTIEYMGF